MLTRVKGSVIGEDLARQTATVLTMTSLEGVSVGDKIETGENTDGNGGGGTYDAVLTSSVTPNTFNIIIGVADPLISFVLSNGSTVDLKKWGAGVGLTDDRPIFQSAIDQGFVNFLNSDGTYLLGAAGTTIVYRATTANESVICPNNIVMLFSGYNSIVKVKGSANAIPFSCDAKTNVTFGNFRIEGNAANNATSLNFGLYFLNSTGVNLVGTIWTNETYDNAVELIGCSNVRTDTLDLRTSTSGSSIGGGIQLEDCSDVILGKTTGNVKDDLVSVIAHGANTSDLSLGDIQGQSSDGRALFIGQSSSAVAQRTLTNIKADINCHDCAIVGTSAAVVVNRGGIYENINLNVIDTDSYQTLRVIPFDGTYNGSLRNCEFNVKSIGAKNLAIDIRHDDNASTVITGNKLNAMIINPNTNDTSVEQAIELQGGERWDLNLNITYPTGKTNVATAVTLGIGGATNAKVEDSNVRGIISGGDTNLSLVNTDNVNLDSLITVNSENVNNINIDITSGSLNTLLGNVIRDGEIQDNSTSTQRKLTQLFSSVDNNDTGVETIETDLTSYTLPADWMGKTGTLHIKASGVITGAGGNKTLKFYFGGTSHTIHAAANDTGDWSVDIYIRQAGDRASQRLDITTVYGTSVQSDGVSDGVSTTSAVVIKFTGLTANSGDLISQRTMVIDAA